MGEDVLMLLSMKIILLTMKNLLGTQEDLALL